jgi:ABC-2 type transport system permease protein
MAIAKNEARLVWRRRSSWLLWALFLILLSVAALLSHARQSRERQQQEHYQALVRQQWLEQPDRHPHRVAHYGSFAFKPRSLLAGFDPGVEAQVGRVQYLEAHRQNALNFAEAGALTAAGRLGELSPALVAGPLLALVIAMLGHGVLAEERELGRLSLLCAQGVGSVMLTWGKAAGLALAVMPFFILVPLTQGAAVLLSPAEPSFAETLLDGDGPLVRGALLMLGLLLHALIWVLITVLVSKLSRTRAHSAAVLLCLWLCTMVVLPRAASGLAASLHPLPTRSDFTAHMAAELEKLGDSHNPDDPAFVRFREQHAAGEAAQVMAGALQGARAEVQFVRDYRFTAGKALAPLGRAMDVLVRMVALLPFVRFLASEHCSRMLAGLQRLGRAPLALTCAAVFRKLGRAADFDSGPVFLQNDIGHAGYGIGAVDRRGTVGDDFNALD